MRCEDHFCFDHLEDAMKDYWFPAKKYGFGWGLPQTWQGWVTVAVFLLCLELATYFFQPRENPVLYSLVVVLLSAIFLVVVYLKGEPSGFR